MGIEHINSTMTGIMHSLHIKVFGVSKTRFLEVLPGDGENIVCLLAIDKEHVLGAICGELYVHEKYGLVPAIVFDPKIRSLSTEK